MLKSMKNKNQTREDKILARLKYNQEQAQKQFWTSGIIGYIIPDRKRGNMKLSKKQIESKFPPIINGAYKKDMPSKDIGYQKWEVRKTYEVEMVYEIVAKTQQDADDLLSKEECIKLEDVDGYGKTFRETITGKHSNDMSGDEVTTWTKIEECVPSEDTDSDNDFKPFLNYEDGDWQKDDYQWLKNEDGTNIEKK